MKPVSIPRPLFCVAAVLALAVPCLAAMGVPNFVAGPDFEGASPLNPWTIFSAPPGQSYGVTNFDIDGDGPLEPSRTFFARPGAPGGAALSLQQEMTVWLYGLHYEFHADIASVASLLSNADGGTVTMRIGNQLIAQHAFNDILSLQTEYAALSGSFQPQTPGNYLLSLEISRQYQVTMYSPTIYVDNIQLSMLYPMAPAIDPVVPEPAAILLTSLGALLLRRKSRIAT